MTVPPTQRIEKFGVYSSYGRGPHEVRAFSLLGELLELLRLSRRYLVGCI